MKHMNKRKLNHKDGQTAGHQKKNQKVQTVPSEKINSANLDRFAGSSEDDDDDTYDDEVHSSHRNNQNKINEYRVDKGDDNSDSADSYSTDQGEDDDDDDDEYGDEANVETASFSLDADDEDTHNHFDDEDSSSESDGYDQKHNHHLSKKEGRGQLGMADAMSRILGMGKSDAGKLPKTRQTSTNNIVLSKTVTPLQKRQRLEKEDEMELNKKQKQRRARNLTAMHTPISSLTMGSIPHDACELELERAHRRVATRGVVALFNAITQHQHQRKQQATTTQTNSNNAPTKPLTKYGFLEMIKNSAQKADATTLHALVPTNKETADKQSSKIDKDEEPYRSKNAKVKSKKGWNALKDDFMMNSKLKDWDKELSDDDFDAGEEDHDSFTDEDNHGRKDDDDFMDDDDD